MAGSDIYRGTLDTLILRALSAGPMHGYAVGLWLRRHSGDVVDIKEGVLYPALHRILRRGWVSASWGSTDTGRRARFYRLTDEGRQRLAEEAPRLAEHSKAVLTLLERAPG
jgi:transcriptional regulator